MSNIIKKPYEISLWEEQLMWHRCALEPVKVYDLEYEVGKYYSQNQEAYGNIPYTIDNEEWREGRQYYKISLQGPILEGENAEAVSIEDLEEWINTEDVMSVRKISEIADWNGYDWFTYSSEEDEYIPVEEAQLAEKPQKDVIYYRKVTPGEGYIPNTILQYYKEVKVAIIGSDTMDSPIRANSGKLTSKVNGSNELTFSIYSKYWDEEAKCFYDNPFINLLVNERKVKLRHGAIGAKDCKWYDLIIKNVSENSESKIFSYTAKDQFVNELSKSGFNIVLDAELENNMGNINTLAEYILEESDWKLGNDNDVLVQYKEEPLYKIQLNRDIIVKNMQDENESRVIKEGEYIYGFYSLVVDNQEHFQLLYTEEPYEVDDDYVITNSKVWYLEGVTYTEYTPDFATSIIISEDYRGKRFVRQLQTKYDPITDQYVNVYNVGEEVYYGYTETEYVCENSVSNFVTNPTDFTSLSGWSRGLENAVSEESEENKYPKLDLQGYPDIRDIDISTIEQTEFLSLLKYRAELDGQILFNSGIGDFRLSIGNFTEEEKYVFRIKYATATENSEGRPTSIAYQTVLPNVKIGRYELSNGVYSIKDLYFSSEDAETTNSDNYVQAIFKCKRNATKENLLDGRFGMFIAFPKDVSYYIEDVQFFKYVTYDKEILDENGEGTGRNETIMAIPGGEIVAQAKVKYYYYIPDESYEDESQVEYIYTDYIPWDQAKPKYNDDQFEKIRSITASESNRFNLIQTLCETFECWPRFTVERNMETGEILLDKTDGFRQKKWVTFHEYIGKDNYAGFKYGINLKNIQRTLDSEGAVSKMIVKSNANQFAYGGSCNISRASENPIKENFLLDFSHYIQQGLINRAELTNDLYLEANGYLGYYNKLRKINKDREKEIEEQALLKGQLSDFEAQYVSYKVLVEEGEEEALKLENEVFDTCGWTYVDMLLISKLDLEKEEDFKKLDHLATDITDKEERKLAFTEAKSWWEQEEFVATVTRIVSLKNQIKRYIEIRDRSEQVFNEAKERYDSIQEYLDKITVVKKALNLQFYKKYSRFIQEGSWINEDYVDDNLYYIDAENTLRNSAQPKVTYNIGVLELSQQEDFSNYLFELGDKTYIEDTEFFGWTWKNGIQTPYHEEIVVSEIVFNLDSPEQNSIKVQNYKTQFEDLFQRITATTQSIEYHTGEYARSASVVQADGTLSFSSLQTTIANNAIRLENVRDQSVIWDESGITSSNLSNPSEIIRIYSGGLFLTTDGGKTWGNAISGAGISANYITAGVIDVSRINIKSGDFASFKWDQKGISAYQFHLNEETRAAYGFNYGKFVRFDQYGIYGINGDENFDATIRDKNNKIGENKIWDNAKYALTWKGFMLKNDDGSVRITSTDDIQVLKGQTERIKIGRLDKNGELYGIRISNHEEQTVMETDSNGELWLRNRLRVGTEETSTVEIGYLEAVRADTEIHEVIHAGDENEKPFIVYEDGRVVASYIEALGGRIGNMTIGEVSDTVEKTRKLDISSNLGYNFKVERGVASPQIITLTAVPVVFEIFNNEITWYGSKDFEHWDKLSERSLNFELTYDLFKENQNNSTYYIKAEARGKDNKMYEKWVTIMSISDGAKGEDALTLVITSSNGNYFKNNIGSTILVAHLFKAGEEVDIYPPYDYTYTWKDAATSEILSTEKTYTVTASDVEFNRTYICDIGQGGN